MAIELIQLSEVYSHSLDQKHFKAIQMSSIIVFTEDLLLIADCLLGVSPNCLMLSYAELTQQPYKKMAKSLEIAADKERNQNWEDLYDAICS